MQIVNLDGTVLAVAWSSGMGVIVGAGPDDNHRSLSRWAWLAGRRSYMTPCGAVILTVFVGCSPPAQTPTFPSRPT